MAVRIDLSARTELERCVPHYDIPLRDIALRLKHFRDAAPWSAFRSRLWGAASLGMALTIVLGVAFAPLIRPVFEGIGPPLSTLLAIVMLPLLALLPFFIMTGARLLSGYGSFVGVVAWFLSLGVPWLLMILAPVFGAVIAGPAMGVGSGVGGLIGFGGAVWLARVFEDTVGKRAKAAALPTARHARLGDRRRPILFLRSFQDDDQAVSNTMRLEDTIAATLARYGPVIAVGQPGVLPKSGAARAFYDGSDWQEAVTTWMSEALLIVMVAGYTAGLRWELDELIKRNMVRKLIVVFPPDQKHFEARWRRLEERFVHQPLGADIGTVERTNTIALHANRSGSLVVLASSSGQADYKTALELAIYGVLADGDRLSIPQSW